MPIYQNERNVEVVKCDELLNLQLFAVYSRIVLKHIYNKIFKYDFKLSRILREIQKQM